MLEISCKPQEGTVTSELIDTSKRRSKQRLNTKKPDYAAARRTKKENDMEQELRDIGLHDDNAEEEGQEEDEIEVMPDPGVRQRHTKPL